MDFAKILTNWYLASSRELPWRATKDPYRIWLSEIILQQTRVSQGLPYYLAFVEAFPTVSDLAAAHEQQVLKLWQGLGYYSRARNLYATARIVAGEFGGVFPENYAGLLRLKGIGPYTAAAIASFAFDEAVPVVDGNVFRVLSRYFGVYTDISSSAARKEFTVLAAAQLPAGQAAVFNQAIMEFGALQCVPSRPDCDSCPLQEDCYANRHRQVDVLPVKSKKKPPRNRHLNYLVFRDDFGQTLVRKRVGKDIWRNLYEFPLIETPDAVSLDRLVPLIDAGQEMISVSEPQPVLHKLTHQHLHIRFWKVRVKGKLENGVPGDEVRQLPFPAVLFKFIEASGV